MRKLALLLSLPATFACTEADQTTPDIEARLDAMVPALLKSEKAAGVGIAIIRDGELHWSGYYGEQAPGTPVGEATAFNTASVAKTITAETLIALERQGLIDYDEPIADFVEHPELSDDTRYLGLTTQLLMSHRAGLLNWAYAYPDGRLAFDHDPGTRFSYSGAGVELAARYAEAKTGKPLQTLADEYVFAPLGIKEVSLGDIPPWADERIAVPMDSEGSFRPIAELNPLLGDPNAERLGAADDLIVTVPAYAQLITALTSGLGDDEARSARQTILTSFEGDPVYDCPDLEDLKCPDAYGHSIGWQIFQYDDHTIVTHSGSDAGENALVYYSPDKKHGAVVFVNGANGWFLMTRIIEIIGDEPLLADYYRGLITTVMGRDMPALSAE
ncbi:MAG: serine hydrolase domain-containing protein [Pseudomonadota bacterium]